MKKIFFLTLLAVLTIVGKSHAQEHLVATLDHEGIVSVFTGEDAFVKANEAANDGDVITLSQGNFKAGTKITKAISLYGAGISPYDKSTRFTDTLAIEIPSNADTKLVVEGINFSDIYTYGLSNATFRKCIANFYLYAIEGRSNKIDFIHCLIGYLRNSAGSATLINCFVSNLCYTKYYENTTDCKYICNNCHLGLLSYVYNNTSGIACNSVFTNCVLYVKDNMGESGVKDNISMYSCLITGPTSHNGRSNDIEEDCRNIITEKSSLYFDKSPSNVFQHDMGDFYFDYSFEYDLSNYQLTDNAKSAYLGNDGTEVGIFGGAMPYNPTPSVPRIKSFRMDAKPSEGILKADVEVE